MKRKIRMRDKILLLSLCSTLIALLLQTVLFENTSAKLIYQQAQDESYNSLQNMQNDVHTFTQNIENNLIRIYNQKDLIQSLRNKEEISELKEQYYRLAYTVGSENFSSSDGVLALYIYTNEHELISTYRRAVTPKHNYPTDIYNAAEEQNADIVKSYIESNDANMLISSYYNSYRETDIVRFVLKIFNKSNLNDKLGYLVCDVDSKVIRSMMQKYSISQEMYIWLQPEGDRPVTSIGKMNEEDAAVYEETAKKIQNSDAGEMEQLSSQNQVFFQTSQSGYNLNAYTLMPRYLLSQNQKALTKNLLLIAVIMVLATTITTIFISRSLTRPLVKLTETMKRIRKGDTRQRAEITNRDEIGELAQSFNKMLDEMEVLISKEYKAKLLQNRAEYKALQAQINPHFLYNTLDTMGSIAQVQNCTQVSGLCQSLSNLFRYSLNMKNPFSTIAKEIVHIKNYIYVMNVRMRDEVQYQFEIDDSVLSDTLPRITIQPLIENALNHGLRNKRGEKKIVISAHSSDAMLEIVVWDNGVGMSQERIAAIMEDKLQQDEEDGSTSIGLSNIHSRIRMLYGEEAVLAIKSESEEGTRITIRIPRMKMEEVNLWTQ